MAGRCIFNCILEMRKGKLVGNLPSDRYGGERDYDKGFWV